MKRKRSSSTSSEKRPENLEEKENRLLRLRLRSVRPLPLSIRPARSVVPPLPSGIVYLPGFLSLEQQHELIETFDNLKDAAPAFIPSIRMYGRVCYQNVYMTSVGWHWNALKKRYEKKRDDFDSLPVPHVLPLLSELYKRAVCRALAVDPSCSFFPSMRTILTESQLSELRSLEPCLSSSSSMSSSSLSSSSSSSSSSASSLSSSSSLSPIIIEDSPPSSPASDYLSPYCSSPSSSLSSSSLSSSSLSSSSSSSPSSSSSSSPSSSSSSSLSSSSSSSLSSSSSSSLSSSSSSPSPLHSISPSSLSSPSTTSPLHSAVSLLDSILPLIPTPDMALLNYYRPGWGKMGNHKDDAEGKEAIQRGDPVVSFSIGDSADFSFSLPSTSFASASTSSSSSSLSSSSQTTITLHSGDVLLFGGEARLIYHGVPHIYPRTRPLPVQMVEGRVNITLRKM